MSVTSYDDDLRLAHVIADSVDALTMGRFLSEDLHVEAKPDLTLVSDADRDAESLIRRLITNDSSGGAAPAPRPGGHGAPRTPPAVGISTCRAGSC